MKKILHIINGEFFAGAERVQDLLATRLPDFGYECGFVCLKNGAFEKYRRSTVPMEIVPMKSKFDLSIINRISKIAEDGQYVAVHTHTARSALIGRLVARKLNISFFHHVHSPAGRDTENKFRNITNSLIEKYLILSSADRLIAVSSSLKSYLLQMGVDANNISVVANGVPVIRSIPAWCRPESQWVIGTVALFRPRKGIEILLLAIRKLIDSGQSVCLKAVGTFETKEYELTIKKMVVDLDLQDNVRWTGFSADVHGEMESMDIFVLPSLFGEGLPMVVIEAMSVGVPVVASNVEGIPEVLISSDYGEVVSPGDADALFTGILKLIVGVDDLKKIAAAAHNRQREKFSDISMAKGVAEIYDEVLR